MSNKLLPSLSLLLLPMLAFGQGVTSWECTMDGNLRRVVILTEPGVTVPCEVQYHKDTEAPGNAQVLWSASTQADYCEVKATEFVARLEGMGWSCSAGAATDTESAPEPEPAAVDDASDADQPSDDTAALEPANAD